MKAYKTYFHRDSGHPNGAPTPKWARSRESKKSCRQEGQASCQTEE